MQAGPHPACMHFGHPQDFRSASPPPILPSAWAYQDDNDETPALCRSCEFLPARWLADRESQTMTALAPQSYRTSKTEFIALCAGLMGINALAIDITLPILPHIGEALNVMVENDRQLVISAYLFGFGIAQLFFGPICDRFGRRWPTIIGVGIYVAAALAAIFMPTFTSLLAVRLLQGLGAAATRIALQAAIRDRYDGRDMAQVMSLVFMVFLVVPVIAPTVGQLLYLTGHWQAVFMFMGFFALVIGLWSYLRFDETLHPEYRRPISVAAISSGYMTVLKNRFALAYAIAGTCMIGALLSFINTAQQIYVDIYGLGDLFPLAFAAVAGLMSVSSFLNSRAVGRFGMRRLSHGALLAFIGLSGVWFLLAWLELLSFWLFFGLFASIMFMFGWCSSNMNSLSLEPLGNLAGTASSVFGFLQTAGGAVIGGLIGHTFQGDVLPIAAGFFFLGLICLVCVLVAEKGKLFGVGEKYAHSEVAEAGH
jgi:MFS transporter, DHA1 family, multidrug resistance protein